MPFIVSLSIMGIEIRSNASLFYCFSSYDISEADPAQLSLLNVANGNILPRVQLSNKSADVFAFIDYHTISSKSYTP